MLRTIVIVLALALMASGQNEIGRKEMYYGREATNCILLPPAHPRPVMMRVSPNSQLLGYIGVGTQSEQALYFRSSACSTEPWQLFAAASAFVNPPQGAEVGIGDLLITDSSAYVLAGILSPVDRSFDLRWVWKLDPTANSKVLLAAEGELLGGIRPSNVISFTVTRGGEEILVARVGNNKIFRLSGGQWNEMVINGVTNRTVTGVFAHPAGLVATVAGANFQSDVLLWNGSTTTTVVDSRKQVLGEDLLSCCQVLNSQGLSLIQYNAINFYPDGGPKLATRVAEVLGDGGLRIVLADDGQRQPSSVWGVFPESSSDVHSLVANHFFSHRKSTGFASSLHLWDDIVGRQTVVVDDRGLLFGARVSALVVTPAGPDPRVVGGIWNNTASVGNNGTVFVALRRIDVLNGGLFNGRHFDSVVRLAIPPPPPPPVPTATLTVDPLAIQTGQSTVLRWITANATAVSINQGIGSVSASGNRTVAPASTTTYTLTATGLGGTATARVTVTVTDPRPRLTSVVNAYSHEPGFAPCMWAEGYGANLAPTTVIAQQPFPIILGGTTVHIIVGAWDGWAPLLFVSPSQVNFQVPCDAPTSGKAMIIVMTEQGGESAPVVLDASTMSVGLYRNGTYAQKADGSEVGYENPLNPGDHLVVYAVGLGQTTPPATTGQPAPLDQLRVVDASAWRLDFNGFTSSVVFAGMAPGYVGLYQLNLQLPADLPPLGASGPAPSLGKLVIEGREYDITLITN